MTRNSTDGKFSFTESFHKPHQVTSTMVVLKHRFFATADLLCGFQDRSLDVQNQPDQLHVPESTILSLIKRVRELVVGAPALIAWQVAEGKHLFSLRPRATARAATNEALAQPVLERSSGD